MDWTPERWCSHLPSHRRCAGCLRNVSSQEGRGTARWRNTKKGEDRKTSEDSAFHTPPTPVPGWAWNWFREEVCGGMSAAVTHWSGTQSRGMCMEWRAWCPSSWQNVKLKAKLSPESTEGVNLLSGYAAWLFKRRKILSRVAQVVLGSKLKGHMSCFPHELVTISPSLGQQIRVLAASFCGSLFVTNDQNCFDEHNLKSTSPAWKQCAGAPFLIFQLLYGHSYLHAVSTQLKVWEILCTPLCRLQTALDCLVWKNWLLWSVTMILVAYVM